MRLVLLDYQIHFPADGLKSLIFSLSSPLFLSQCPVWFWDQRVLFNLWVKCYIFHSFLNQLFANSTLWTWLVSLREVKVGHRRELLSTLLYWMFPLMHSTSLLLLIIIRKVWRWPRTQTSLPGWRLQSFVYL